MRKLPLISVALAGFLLASIVFLPAQVIAYFLPASITVGTLSGSLWKGSTDALAIDGQPLGALQWNVHPFALLTGKLSLDAELSSAETNARGEIAFGMGGGIEARDLKLNAPLSALPAGLAPVRWNGRVQADVRKLSLQGKELKGVLGTLDVHDLQAPPPDGLTIGSYRLSFDESSHREGRWIGKLQDLGGPLQVAGTLTLGTKRDYLLEGTVAPGAGASEAISNTLRFLGPPDARGQRPFSIAGTY